jgi:hypothetical protein
MNNIVDDFPLTIIEGRKLNREQWDFGDALLEECGAPSEAAKHDGSRHRIVEAVAALEADGQEYDERYLAMLREIAWKFPPNRRHLKVSWSAHRHAQTPDLLDAIVAGAPAGQTISNAYVDAVRKGDQERQKQEREEALAEAKAAEAEAKAAMKTAKAKRKAAQTDAERWAAEAEANLAAEKAEEARRAAEEAKIAPKRGKPRTVHPDDVEVLYGEQKASKCAHEAKRLSKDAKRFVKSRLNKISAVMIAALTEEGLGVANAWNDFATMVRRSTIHQRSHLHAVNE